MKPETRFWKWLEGVLPSGHYSRVEPPPSPGIPDVNACVGGIESWIELKVGDNRLRPFGRRRKDGVCRGLRTSQRRWIRLRLRNHGRVFVFVAVGSDFYIFTGAVALTLNEESTKQEFYDKALAVFERRACTELTNGLRTILTGDYRNAHCSTSDDPL